MGDVSNNELDNTKQTLFRFHYSILSTQSNEKSCNGDFEFQKCGQGLDEVIQDFVLGNLFSCQSVSRF